MYFYISDNIGNKNISLVHNDVNEQSEDSNICCILDCVNCLMVLHYDTLIKDNNRQQFMKIEDSCISCLIELFKFYEVISYFIFI